MVTKTLHLRDKVGPNYAKNSSEKDIVSCAW